MAKLTNEERLVLNSELERKGKSKIVAYILLIFLGGLAIHRFYLNRNFSGVLMLGLNILGWLTSGILIGYLFLLIFWIWWFVDLFLTNFMVNSHNDKLEAEILNNILENRNNAQNVRPISAETYDDADFEEYNEDNIF